MNESNYRVSLDIHNTAPQALLIFNQYDTARKITFALTENGKPYNISSDVSCIISAVKPDGTSITNPCVVDYERNTIYYTVTSQTTSAVGTFNAQLTIMGTGDIVISTPIFSICVREVVVNNIDLESTSEFNALVEAYNAFNEDYAERIQDLENAADNWSEIVEKFDDLATKDSPEFVGTPTAPTPSSEDDSTKIATTAFVQAITATLRGLYDDIVAGRYGQIPPGGSAGDILKKLSNTDHDIGWGALKVGTPVDDDDPVPKGYLDEIERRLSGAGRYLSSWNCVTGMPGTFPATTPYTYETGDYFIVTKIASAGGTNYMPDGTEYTGEPSEAEEEGEIHLFDMYRYDGTTWELLPYHLVLDAKLDKITSTSYYARAYGVKPDGGQTSYPIVPEPIQYTLAYRGANGVLKIGTPSANDDAVPKGYADGHYLAKDTSTTTYPRIYYKDADGTPKMIDFVQSAVANSIAYRGAGGTLKVGTPSASSDAVPKSYADSHYAAIGSGGSVYSHRIVIKGVESYYDSGWDNLTFVIYSNSNTPITKTTLFTDASVKACLPAAIDGTLGYGGDGVGWTVKFYNASTIIISLWEPAISAEEVITITASDISSVTDTVTAI